MVKVCDAIMGNGKTSASISYMNEHKDDKFIFITPYLKEAARIKAGCPDLHFVEPSDNIAEYDFRKSVHAMALIDSGANITTTHQAFKGYTQETLDRIKEQEYTLIIDENVDVLETFDFNPADLQLAVDAGYITESNGLYTLARDDYSGSALREMFRLLRSRDLIRISNKRKNSPKESLFYWALPRDLITSFKNVFILTYLFEGQSLHHFMTIYDIPYEFIGIDRGDDGSYRFGELPGYTPAYVSNLHNMIHILDNPRLNAVGDDYYSLSMKWFDKGGDGVSRLKKNMYNLYNNIWGDIPADRKLWGSYVGKYHKIKGKGYTKSFLTFNAKATNEYRHRDCLVYVTNIFMNVNEKTFYEMHGIDVDEDLYALSIMIQWIWRSAIRDGNEVHLYIPSKRMRSLLERWIEQTSKGW